MSSLVRASLVISNEQVELSTKSQLQNSIQTLPESAVIFFNLPRFHTAKTSDQSLKKKGVKQVFHIKNQLSVLLLFKIVVMY